MRSLAKGSLLVVAVAVIASCSAAAPTPTPTPQPPVLNGVMEGLGYVLVPDHLPDDFHLFSATYDRDTYSADLRYATLTDHQIWLSYPTSLSLNSGAPRPDDAISQVEVHGNIAYLLRGAGVSIRSPDGTSAGMAKWDYDLMTFLFFDYHLSEDETVPVMLAAAREPREWISEAELIRVAESLRLLS